jgi:Ca-activated chloride channel homolog
MTRTHRTLVVGCITLLLLANPATVLADGMVLPLLPDMAYLEVTHHDVTVDLQGVHAVTHVDQAFHNPTDAPIRGHYVFPIPPDAMLSSFSATLDGADQSVDHQSAGDATRMLNDRIADRRDPSLLQYADWEAYTFELTVEPHETRTMTLTYEEVVQPSGGALHYHYVLSTERYSARPLDEVSIVVNVKGDTTLGAVYSSSHPVAVERSAPDEAQATYRAENVHPDEDFHLFITPAIDGFGSALLTGTMADAEGQQQEHFLFLFAPEVGGARETAMPKDLILILDRSGSMSGEKIVQAKQALHFILDHLNPEDRFSIVAFNDRLDVFSRQLAPASAEMQRQAHGFVDDLIAEEGTDIDGALLRGLDILDNSDARSGSIPLVVFLTDGLPTVGLTDPTRIVERAGRANAQVEARLHVFGVGYDVNSHLLDHLAGENGGSVTYVQPGENLELRLSAFYRKIANPVLTDLAITFEGMETWDTHPQPLPDMFEGSSLLLTGRAEILGDDPITVHVRGRARDEDWHATYTFEASGTRDHTFVPRLWATRQVGELLDEVRVKGETEALVAEIRMLGLTYGLVTPYTIDVIAAQTNGAASLENMTLYQDQTNLNRASGQTTIQARVQNQAYQQAEQVAMAQGANVRHQGAANVAQYLNQQIDLALIQQTLRDGSGSVADLTVDRTVRFGSEAYFALARDPELRPLLQSGTNVLFEHEGQVIQVLDEENPPDADWQEALAGQPQPLSPTQNQGPFVQRPIPRTDNRTSFLQMIDRLQRLLHTLLRVVLD